MPEITCPYCAAKLNAPAEYEGHRVKCATCRSSFVLRFTSARKPVIAVKINPPADTEAEDLAATEQFTLAQDPTAAFRLPGNSQPTPSESNRPPNPSNDSLRDPSRPGASG